MAINKLGNEYANMLGSLFEDTPKAVLGAMVVSLLTCGGDNPEGLEAAFLAEWEALYLNRIVPQKPAKARKPQAVQA
jgi:hypothetical protein